MLKCRVPKNTGNIPPTTKEPSYSKYENGAATCTRYINMNANEARNTLPREDEKPEPDVEGNLDIRITVVGEWARCEVCSKKQRRNHMGA